MGDTNYFSSIVKVLDNPIKTILNDKIGVTTFRAEIPQFRTNRIVILTFWGNLAHEAKSYYQINDYILVEGYLSIRTKQFSHLFSTNSNKLTITVLKVYPFLLKSDPNISKG